MRKSTALFSLYVVLLVAVFGLTGCTVIFQKGRRKDAQQLNQLQQEYTKLQDEMSELERAKAELENRLRKEIADKDASIQMKDRGLVITFVSEVLFDSGKAKLRQDSFEKLDKVGQVLQTTVRDLSIGVEGHTDNIPIKHSGWKSNWELSSARALSVLHYFADEHGLDPQRLSATAYGEFQPVASNDTNEGRQQNRRVEIIILPKVEKKEGEVPSENLK